MKKQLNGMLEINNQTHLKKYQNLNITTVKVLMINPKVKLIQVLTI